MLRVAGWRIEGRLPDRSRFVMIVAPHTSNWDFWFGICAIFALGIRVSWIGKHTLFRGPFGPAMRWLGGEPVDRGTTTDRVARLAAVFRERERFVLGLSPEGTRKRTERWRTGFYHVALAAGVPIVLGYLDYSRRVVGIGPPFEPTGEVESDLERIRRFYDPRWARRPERF